MCTEDAFSSVESAINPEARSRRSSSLAASRRGPVTGEKGTETCSFG